MRGELEPAGHHYKTRSDTETILHAYEQWGDGSVEHLRGMFAFGIWDAPRRRLFLARDRLGVKPLYWAMAGDRLIFGSEIKAILESGLVRVEANEGALPELLGTRYLSGTETLFKGVHCLQPGHTLVFEKGAVSIRRYWDIPAGQPSEELGRLSDAELVSRFRELLEEAVRIRLMADVPLGMFLSGGLDSSAIAALMAKMIDRPLQTFSVAFKQRAFSELGLRPAGRHRHRRGRPRDRHRRPGLLRRAAAADLARRRADRASVEHSAVLRLGAGARACQGRPDRRRQRRIAGRIRQVSACARELARGGRLRSRPGASSPVGRRPRRAEPSGPSRPVRDALVPRRAANAGSDVLRQFRGDWPPAAGGAALAGARGPGDSRARLWPSRAFFDAPNGQSTTLDRLLYADMKTYLVELLMKQDQMSMAASIESRVPFLDHRLVEFAAGLPARMKLRGFTTKRILREAVRGILPAEILTRKKMGFPVPFGIWMRGRGRTSRATCCSIRAAASAASSNPRRSNGSSPRMPPAWPTAQTRSGACSTWSSGTARISMARVCRHCPGSR